MQYAVGRNVRKQETDMTADTGIRFPDNYFEDEVREGFYVCGMMKREWAAQMVILQEFSRLCDRLGITWYAAYGTLLGAVRHKGFIPWDDDIDVWLRRRDYEKFVRHVHELPENYVFLEGRLNREGKLKYMNPFGRILNTPDFCADAAFLQKYGGFPYPSGLDIFVLDRLAPTKAEEDVRVNVAEYVWYVMHHLDEDRSVLNGRLGDIEKITGVRIDRNRALDHQLMLIFEQLNVQFEDSGGEYVTSMHDWARVQSYKFHDSCFDSTVELPFENITIRVPAGYDEILTSIWGDYRKPVQALTHDYPCYRISEEGMEAAGSELPYKYYFHPECLEVPPKAERKGVIRKALSDFARRHQEMENQILQIDNSEGELPGRKFGDTRIEEELRRAFGDAQDAAAFLERLLTGNYPFEQALAQILHDYGEKIVQAYQQITGTASESPEKGNKTLTEKNCSEDLQELALLVQRKTEENIIRPREVVFLPFKAEGWKNLKPLYEHYRKMPDVRVYVAPIPYYRKDAWFDPEKTPVYEGEEIRKIVMGSVGTDTVEKDGKSQEILPYTALNLAVHTPDVVVTQNPYDEFGIGFTVDPAYYSALLQKQAGEVIYVPWFETDEIVPEHGAAWSIACEYIDMPGVIRADCVLVSSEHMREVYIGKLTDFAGESTRKRWEKTVRVSERDEHAEEENAEKEK